MKLNQSVPYCPNEAGYSQPDIHEQAIEQINLRSRTTHPAANHKPQTLSGLFKAARSAITLYLRLTVAYALFFSTPAFVNGQAISSDDWTQETFSTPETPPNARVLSLPTAVPTSQAQLEVVPQFHISPGYISNDPLGLGISNFQRPSSNLSGSEQPFVYVQESLPPPIPAPANPSSAEIVTAEPVFEPIVREYAASPSFYINKPSEPGLGHERLAFSLFDIDPAQPTNSFRARMNLAYGYQLPDRSEYLWAATGVLGPPVGETSIDYQEARLRLELGSKKFSTSIEVPFRAVDPELNANHAGLSDLQLSVKTVLFEGKETLLTTYFGTKFNTGSTKMGLGTGSVALEPGLLFRRMLKEETWLHGEFKFWFPVAGDLNHRGQVIKFATGLNHVLWEDDSRAIIPTLEMSSFTFLNGLARDASQALHKIDGDFVFNLTPGIRYTADTRRDIGLFDIGAAWSLPATPERLSDGMFIIETRLFW